MRVKNRENSCVLRLKAVPLHRIYALLSTYLINSNVL